ncbi:MAG: 16S rRNA (cytidine(1402)-2'-O)-methyltransferase [Candidatus Magasanikbacteria bacterium CG10_big_fil_rev_8_21_14_0_10_47_10]|uniref:Ribosomal RNA small subunit methyltransferase I n=1 Tax=Candidatus Magasanikbacteria bacterium CG10_big_fil_rev_8_21_14_0_10_47_10 TaxID=1974652 RepID=A0A2H0TST6_9BACT|nr:MAG: 16S rRNA (cytidine(1402)-2'-O)-methyltransferase [Candidatus Magasanikbacteria bacterium CG10_big_fil_rev_8_21_14_0_10_47_10]
MTSGTVYIVATPIGNLGDITRRAIETFEQVDVIFCEDTRVTRSLLNHVQIKTPTRSFHQHSDEKTYREIEALLGEGSDIALVSDAGTPGISDPGNTLVAYLSRRAPGVRVVPIPGASALLSALSVSGLPTDKFLFLGFPPHKKRRAQFFEEVAASAYTVAFYESPHRIEKALASLASVLGPHRQVCVCRELTKKFESIYRGTIQEILAMGIPAKGEFTVVVSGISFV